MSDAYVPISFVADELLTSTKMNQLAADLSYFHDGTGLGDGIILTRHLGADQVTTDKIPNRTRRFELIHTTDGGTGTSFSFSGGGEVQFTGTPAGFVRARGRVPADFVAGTTAVLKLLLTGTATNNIGWTYYIGSATPNSGFSDWNIAYSASATLNYSNTAQDQELALYSFTAGQLHAGDMVLLAAKPTGAVSGNLSCRGVAVEYTADS